MNNILVISDFPELQYAKDSGTPALRLIVEAMQKEYNVHILNIKCPDNAVARKLGHWQIIRENLCNAIELHSMRDFILVYGAGCYSATVAGNMTARTGIPSIGRLFGTYLLPHLNNPVQLAIKHEEVAAFQANCTKYVITNDGTGGYVVAKHFGIPNDKLCFWENGVEKPPERTRTNDGTIRFISMARLEEWKRVDRIITAFLSVAKDNPNVYLDIVGGGPLENELKDLAYADTHLAKQIQFHGQMPRKTALQALANTDVFVSTNDYSNVSNSLMEAMMAGKCCIVWDSGRIRDVASGNCIITEDMPKLVIAFENATLLEIRELYGTNAKRYAANNFGAWDERIEKEMQMIRGLVGR